MTTRFYLDGAEVVGKIRHSADNAPGGGMTGLTSSAHGGSFGSGGVSIDDIAGALDIKGWRPFYVEEDEATPPRIFTGFIGGRTISQSDVFEAPGTARVWDCDLMDLNVILGLQDFRSAASKRGPETDLVRIAWMLANWPCIDYPVFDNGGVGAVNDRNFDESDLRQKFPEEALSEMTLDVRVFWLYWDETAASGEEVSLWWSYPTTVRGTSTVKLSNDSDINGTTILPALNGQQVVRDPAFTYSGIDFKYRNGSFYRQNETTATTYIRRDLVYSTDRIGLFSTADLRADQILDRASTEKDVLTCDVILLNADVNLIKEGYRIEVKFTHLPAYSTYTEVTIQKRTLRRPDNGATDRYVVTLELSNDAPTGIGEGGDPGDFPHVPSPPSIVQQVSGTSTVVMPSPITEGDTLVVSITNIAPGSGFFDYTALGYTLGPLAVPGGGLGTLYKIAGASESQTLGMGGNVRGTWYELPGTWVPGTSDSNTMVTDTGNGIVMDAGPITVGAGSIVFAIGTIGTGGTFNSALPLSFTPGSGMTEDLDAGTTTPNLWTGHAFPSAGSFTAETTNSANVPSPNTPGFLYAEDVPWTMHAVEFVGDVADSPPSPAREVGPETVTMTGDDGTTQYPFADGSLRVFHDGFDQTVNIASYDGAAGTFTLDYTPDVGSTITVTYSGR